MNLQCIRGLLYETEESLIKIHTRAYRNDSSNELTKDWGDNTHNKRGPIKPKIPTMYQLQETQKVTRTSKSQIITIRTNTRQEPLRKS